MTIVFPSVEEFESHMGRLLGISLQSNEIGRVMKRRYADEVVIPVSYLQEFLNAFHDKFDLVLCLGATYGRTFRQDNGRIGGYVMPSGVLLRIANVGVPKVFGSLPEGPDRDLLEVAAWRDRQLCNQIVIPGENRHGQEARRGHELVILSESVFVRNCGQLLDMAVMCSAISMDELAYPVPKWAGLG